MTGWVWCALAFVGGLLLATLGDLARSEIAGWLDLVPHAILRLAAAQLNGELSMKTSGSRNSATSWTRPERGLLLA
jgi:hypothetical protein